MTSMYHYGRQTDKRSEMDAVSLCKDWGIQAYFVQKSLQRFCKSIKVCNELNQSYSFALKLEPYAGGLWGKRSLRQKIVGGICSSSHGTLEWFLAALEASPGSIRTWPSLMACSLL